MRPRAVVNAAWTIAFTGAISSYAMARQALEPRPELFREQTRLWARMVARGAGIRVRAYGTWRLDPRGTYLLMANHQSHVDIVALFLALPMVPGFVAKAELRKIPIFGRAMQTGGHVFIDRTHRDKAFEAIAEAARDVREGGSIVVFPEGTRSSKREVLPFKKGGFHLAKQAGVPVVPVGIRGTASILPKHSVELLPGVCEVHVGEVLSAERVASLSLDGLMDEVRARIVELSGLPPAADRTHA